MAKKHWWRLIVKEPKSAIKDFQLLEFMDQSNSARGDEIHICFFGTFRQACRELDSYRKEVHGPLKPPRSSPQK